MKKLLLIQSFVILGLSLNSCNLFSADNQPETNNGSESAPSQDNQSSSTQSETNSEETETSTSPEPIQSEVSSVAGLKRATDPEEFVQRRGLTPGKNRSDPFTLFPVPPQQKPEPANQPSASAQSQPAPQPQSQPEPQPAPQPQSQPEPQPAPQPQSQPGPQPTPQPQSQPQPKSKPQQQPKVPPQPELAKRVIIQGALKIGNDAVAIVRAPNAKTSRYVRPGEFIANNQVLVKRINMEERPTPTIVLKEVGFDQEVIKPVEEGTAVGATTVRNDSTSKLPTLSPHLNSLSKINARQ